MQTSTIEKAIKENLKSGLETRLIVESVNSAVSSVDVKTDFYDKLGNRLRFMKRGVNSHKEEFVMIEKSNGALKKVSTKLSKAEFYHELQKWKDRSLLEFTSHSEMYNSFSRFPWMIDHQKIWVVDKDLITKDSFYSIEFESLEEWNILKNHIKSGRVTGVKLMHEKSLFEFMKHKH